MGQIARMKAISSLLVSVCNLIEAEGRSLRAVAREEAQAARSGIVSMAVGIAFLLVAVPLFVAGAALLALGLNWWLEAHLSRPLAAALTGLVVLAMAFACLLVCRSITNGRNL